MGCIMFKISTLKMFYQILVEATQSTCTIFDEFSSRWSRGILGGILKKKVEKVFRRRVKIAIFMRLLCKNRNYR